MSTRRSALRFSMPLRVSRRGAGLGNEVIPWAKAMIGAEELRLRLLHPSWGLNERRYRTDFGTSRADWLAHAGLRASMPVVRITPELVYDTGESDYALAMRALAPGIEGRGPVVVTHEQMAGGYLGIGRARTHLLSAFMAPKHVARDLYSVESILNPDGLTVAVHVRAGDFRPDDELPGPGEFNRMLPAWWYESVAIQLAEHFGDRVQFLIFGDESESAERIANRVDALKPPARRLPVLSDLLSMAAADALVCSISSFSMLAAFLSPHPYIWFGPHLNTHGTWRSLWGHEERQQPPNGPTAASLAVADAGDAVLGRGVATGEGGELPDELIERLEARLAMKQRRYNLLDYGVVPALETATPRAR